MLILTFDWPVIVDLKAVQLCRKVNKEMLRELCG